jgi:hypothetical protein
MRLKGTEQSRADRRNPGRSAPWLRLGGAPILAHTKVRRDVVDKGGDSCCATARGFTTWAPGRAQVGKRLLILMAGLDVRVINAADGVLLRHFELYPSVDNQKRGKDGL